MSLAQALSTYMTMNLLVLVGFVALKVFAKGLSARTELRLHYFVISAILVLAFIQPFLPRHDYFAPAARVWSAQSIKNFEYTAPDKGGYLAVPGMQRNHVIEADVVSTVLSILMAALGVGGAIFISRDLRALYRIKRRSYLLRKIGRVSIRASETIKVPFSYWWSGEAHVVVPVSLISNSQDYKISVLHELQHHRHGDTRWIYMLWVLRLLCVVNPIIYLWNRWISEIQEFACDEAVIGHHKVASQDYARCLFKVAESAIDREYVPVCATGLTFLVEGNLLKRRIEKMLTHTNTQKQMPAVAMAVGLVMVMAATAFGAKGLVQDRRVTMAQAQVMAASAQRAALQSSSDFAVVVNPAVLKQLNRFIGTPEGREYMRDSLQRMESYRTLVEQNLRKYNLPDEIMAMPLIESGYQNIVEGKNSGWPKWKAAGIWQFIRSTARNFGLQVDSSKDERLDAPVVTDAAMRYLQSNNLRFKDWHLATMAYNMGENAVQKCINTFGTRDAWTLLQRGCETDKNYMPKLMAAILIMRSPESVQ